MTLLLEAPVSTPPVVRRRRRGLLAVPLVLLLAATGFLLSPRLASFPESTPAVTGAPFVTVPEYGLRGAHILGYEHGRAVELVVPVRNDGVLPVTVTSLDLGGGPAPLLAVGDVDGLPLSLGPGDSGTLTVHAVLTNCRYFHEREMHTYDGAVLGFRTLGRSSSELLRFDRPLMVKSPMLVGCPDRKLNRQAENRRDLR